MGRYGIYFSRDFRSLDSQLCFAVLLQYIFAMKLRILPIAKWEGFAYTILPTLALAMSPLADSARFIRTEW